MTGSAVATKLVSGIAHAHESNLRRLGLMPLVRMVMGLKADVDSLPRPASEGEAASMLASACIVGATRLWGQTKVVYDIDPDLSASLMDMDMDAEFPGEVLRQLPHPNPMFVFREPIEVTNEQGEQAALRGFLVAARPSPNQVISSAAVSEHEGAPYLIVAVVDCYDEKGGVRPYPTHVELFAPTAAGNTTVRKMIDGGAVVREAVVGSEATPGDEALADYIRRLSTVVVAHLLYLCCDKPDIERTATVAPPRKRKGGGRPERSAQVIKIGWRIGPAIRSFHEKVERLRQASVRTGKSVIPHVRRGHPHTFLWGPGRAFKKTKWIPPILVNAALFGEQAEGIVVPVD
ncbi:hypothetical protein AB0A69_08215 [Streptomyces sp. NPDC045431]|uniref:hypothetical protein n=1 Tax=Streptomyces sp. NPDC045431 TaxID=3155613 RepID=UPI0033E5EBD6